MTKDVKSQILNEITNLNSPEELIYLRAEAQRKSELSVDETEEVYQLIQEKLDLLKNVDANPITAYSHYEDFNLSLKNWSEENPDGYSYPDWLLKIAIPEYYPLPFPKIQNKLFAIACFINSAAIPARSPKARKEAELPLLYFCGQSGSGKSEGCSIIGLHYYPSHYKITSADSTGASLRNDLHALCASQGITGSETDPNKVCLAPAFIELNNFEPKWIDQRWGEYKTLIYSVLRSQAISRTGNAEEAGSNRIYHTHVLKAITSVVHPKVISTSLSEFYRRLFFIFTKKSPDFRSISRLDFGDVPYIWNTKIWSNKNKQNWYKWLKNYLGKDPVDVPIKPENYPQSVIFLAIGSYLGYWENEHDAFLHLLDYWDLVRQQEDNYTDDISLLVDEFLDYQRENLFYDLAARSEELTREELIKLKKAKDENLPIPENWELPYLIAAELFDYVEQNLLVSRRGEVNLKVDDYLRYSGWYRSRLDGQWIYSKDRLLNR